ncbi:MAG: hypothetical protein ABJA34_01640 [Pseudonocardiales bacterium]
MNEHDWQMPSADLHEVLARQMVDAARSDSGLSVAEAGRLIRSLARQAAAAELLALHLAFMAAAAEDRAAKAALQPVTSPTRPPTAAGWGHNTGEHAEPRELVDAWLDVAAVLTSGEATGHRLDDHDTQGAINVLMLDLPHDDGPDRLRSRADWIESGADAGTGPLHQPAAVAAALRKVSDRVDHER